MSPIWTEDGQLREFYTYIVSNRSMTLYVGVTSDLLGRVDQHKTKSVPGFTSRYHFDRLVYYETTGDIRLAIEREKKIKGWTRKKKIDLVKSMNPRWEDLAESLNRI